MRTVAKLTATPVLLSLYFWQIVTLPTCLSHHSMQNFAGLQKEHPRGSGPFFFFFFKNTTQQCFRRSAGVFQVRNLKTNSDSYWIMHEQTASSRDKPRINVSPRNPRAEARRRRRGQERRRQIEGGRTERRGKVRIQLKPKWMRKAAPRLPSDGSAPWHSCGYLQRIKETEDGIWGSLWKCGAISRGRRKMSGSKECPVL